MKKKDLEQVMLAFFILFSIIFTIGSFKMQIGTLNEPGPGFLPSICFIFIGILSLITLCRSLINKDSFESYKNEIAINLQILQKPAVMIIALVLYACVLGIFKFLISTCILMLILFNLIDANKWVTSIIATVITVAITYIVFVHWLGIQFS